MTINELVGKKLVYGDEIFFVKTHQDRYYLSDNEGYIASVKKVTSTHIHWFTYMFKKEVSGTIALKSITIINQ